MNIITMQTFRCRNLIQLIQLVLLVVSNESEFQYFGHGVLKGPNLI